MNAALFTGDGRIDIRRVDRPDAPPGGGLLRVEAVGLCGTDLAQYHGRLGLPGERYPIVPGHEIVGRLVAIDAQTAARWGVAEGDRVAVDEVVRCGDCTACRRLEPPCQALRIHGITMPFDEEPGLWGGCAEYMVLTPRTSLHRVDPALAPEAAVLFEPLANALHWLECVALRPGETVVVQGPGHQGLACMAAALAAGAGMVIATGVTSDAERLDAARALGVQHTINVEGVRDVVGQVRELTGGRMADVIIDAAAASTATIPLAVAMARSRGRIALAGFKHGRAVEDLVSDAIVLKKLTIQGVGGSTPATIRSALDLLTAGRVPVGPLLGEVLDLDRLPLAMDLLARRVAHRDAVRVSLRIA